MRHHSAGLGPGHLLLAVVLLLTTSSATGQWLGLQYRTSLGDDQRSGRLSLYVERDRLPGEWIADRGDPSGPRSPASPDMVGLPVFYHGPYVPSLVFDAAVAQSETRQDNLSRLCLSRPLSCTVSGVAFAGSPFLDLGLYRTHREARATLGPVRLAP